VNSTQTPSADALLTTHAAAVTAYFQSAIGQYPGTPDRLREAILYSLLAGGKRLRPTLVLECFRAAAPAPTEAQSRAALAAAGAIELIHTFSLVHDDLPAMDDDDLRRGRPTNHKVYGEAMAILAGDAMTTLAFEFLAREAGPLAPALIVELAHASGPAGMIGGQVLDIDGENKSLTLAQLQHLHRLKTGALLRCSCRMGVIAANGSEAQLAAATAYGQHLGLAFQIVDDLLDVTSTPEQMGKATNKDKDKGKNTYPTLLGLDASRQQAEQELAAALDALNPFGTAAEGLKNLAKFVVQRTH
jgi:geranylgeranyl diphosphate synthase type II